MVYSFDVFDTLITRVYATPTGVFAKMQHTLQTDVAYAQLNSFIRNNFTELRVGAESAARMYFCDDEKADVTLEQIYISMQRTACLSDPQKQMLMCLELETELASVMGIGKNIEHVKELLQRGEDVILISDMYLDSATIRQMLVKADAIFAELPLYVSSEVMKNKYKGELYTYVGEKENLSFDAWIHIGDNPVSDVEIPEKMGITVTPVKEKILLSCEQAALKNREADVDLQLQIGASANARLFAETNSLSYQYGTALGGNLVFSYVNWLIQRCLDKKIKRLYFIARDAFLLKKMADKIIAKNHYDIATFYIYGSRKAWRHAGLTQKHFDINVMARWDALREHNTWEKFAEFLGISVETVEGYLPKEEKDCKAPYTETTFREAISRLQVNSDFKRFILDMNRENRELVQAYLKQEIDVSDEHFAFVELIGSGYTQRSLANIMEEFCPYPVQTFFYHMDGNLDTDNCKFYVYYPVKMFNGGIMELFFTAPHGHTLGYKEENDVVVPILDEEHRAIMEYGLEEYQNGVMDFVEQMLCYENFMTVGSDNISLSMFYRRYIAKEADRELLEYIGDMPYKYSGRESEPVKYAPALDMPELYYLFARGNGSEADKYYKGNNISLSIQRVNDWQRSRWWQIGNVLKNVSGKKIAIYGAGKFGQILYQDISKDSDKSVVAWVDKKYEVLKDSNPDICSVSALKNVDYDCIIIGILKSDYAKEAIRELIATGVDEEKIMVLG